MDPDSSHFLLSRIGDLGDRVCLVREGTKWTYQDLAQRVKRAGAFLNDCEESVLLVGRDFGVDTIALLLANLSVGKVLAPITSGRTEDLLSYAKACGAQGWIDCSCGEGRWRVEPISRKVETDRPELVRRLLEEKRPGLVLFSSGITGKPKAMLHDFANFVEVYRDRKMRSVPILLFLLFDHIGGLNTLFGSLASGMTLVVPSSRDPEAVARLVEEQQVRILPATPTFLNLLLLDQLHERRDLSSLRVITYGAEAMPATLLDRVKKAFPRVRLIQTFGTSETGIARTVPRTDTGLRLDDPGLETRVVEGELWLRSKTQVLGYLNEANDRFTQEGWFRTGDSVVEEEDGSLRFLGRTVEMINVGGEKVFPGEVEAALLQIPEVGACRAYGVNNPILGQAVGVEVVPTREVDPKSLRSLIRKFARENLSRYKTPVQIRMVENIRIGARGKREP